jgi:Membrane-bound metallopeptidase
VRRVIAYFILVTLLISTLTLGVTFAGNEQDKLNDVNNRINQTQKQLNEGKKKENQLNSQIKNLESQIKSTENEINGIKGNISQTESKISIVQQNLAAVEEEMSLQNDALQKRLRVMYKNGDIGLIEILLGSEDITDFMTNMDMIQKIFDNDVEVLKSMKEQHSKIENQKNQLETLQSQLEEQQQSQTEKQSSLQANRGEVANLKAQVSSDNKELANQIDSLNAEADRLVDEIKNLQGDQAYTGGEFSWPVPGHTTITSPFGYRIHPILKVKKLHTGIDISAPTGSKVIAANSGKVIMARYNSSYGNVVMIDHGGGIVTLYAHNSKLVVSTGDQVSKGQLVSYSGSTGMSTGPHVHFEVRVNGVYKDPMGWL